MTLASRITDLVIAIASGINARNVPGASDYEVWKAQGNTGTIDNYRASVLGADMDFATQFNQQIGATPTQTTATEARAGVTQLATRAEVNAGALATKAVSPAQLANYLQYASGVRVTGLQGLVALVQSAFCPPVGTLVHVGYELAQGTEHYASVWRIISGSKAEPLNGVPIILADGASLTALQNNYQASGGLLWNRYLNFDPGMTEVVASRPTGGATSSTRNKWRWIGPTSGFWLWEGEVPDWSFAGNAQNRGTGGTTVNGGATRFTAQGEMMHAHVSLNATAAIGQYVSFIQATAQMQSLLQDAMLTGSAVVGGNWTPFGFYVNTTDNTIRTLTGSIPSGADFAVSSSYRRKIPTA